MTPRPVESYALTRNQSEGSVLRNKDTAGNENEEELEDDDDDDATAEPRLPTSYQQKEGNRAYTEAAKSVDNTYKSSDLGYASDVCDYNVSKSKGSLEQQQQHQQSRREQPFRPVSQLVSQHLKPSSPRLESSLYARRMRLIQKRASVFRASEDIGNVANYDAASAASAASADQSTSSAVPRSVQTPPVNNLKASLLFPALILARLR